MLIYSRHPKSLMTFALKSVWAPSTDEDMCYKTSQPDHQMAVTIIIIII